MTTQKRKTSAEVPAEAIELMAALKASIERARERRTVSSDHQARLAEPEIVWHGDAVSEEPPPEIRHVRDSNGDVADRLGPCDEHPGGSIWRWRHNGNSECWFEIDGTGPWAGWASETQS